MPFQHSERTLLQAVKERIPAGPPTENEAGSFAIVNAIAARKRPDGLGVEESLAG
jgi:hypothetical protein